MEVLIMANYNRNRKSYGGKNNKQQKPTSFACPRKFYSLCSHRLGEGVGLVGIFDKLNPEDNIEQGNIEVLCLEKLYDLISDIPNISCHFLFTLDITLLEAIQFGVKHAYGTP